MNFQFKNMRAAIGIIMLVLICGSLFYWYEFRPAKIKHDCSWYKVVDSSKPAQPAITKEEAQVSQEKYDACKKNSNQGKTTDLATVNIFADAMLDCDGILKYEREAIPAKPETYWYREAKKTEYDYCIHEHGL